MQDIRRRHSSRGSFEPSSLGIPFPLLVNMALKTPITKLLLASNGDLIKTSIVCPNNHEMNIPVSTGELKWTCSNQSCHSEYTSGMTCQSNCYHLCTSCIANQKGALEDAEVEIMCRENHVLKRTTFVLPRWGTKTTWSCNFHNDFTDHRIRNCLGGSVAM